MGTLTDEQVREWVDTADRHQLRDAGDGLPPIPEYGRIIALGKSALRLREKLVESERVRDGVFREMDEVDQRLGRALGYPHYYLKDGKVVGPDVDGAVKDERVCTGDHVPGTLAAEAAGRISALNDQLERLREFVKWAKNDMSYKAPEQLADPRFTIGRYFSPVEDIVADPAAGRARRERSAE